VILILQHHEQEPIDPVDTNYISSKISHRQGPSWQLTHYFSIRTGVGFYYQKSTTLTFAIHRNTLSLHTQLHIRTQLRSLEMNRNFSG
jgi:hypothetical protein